MADLRIEAVHKFWRDYDKRVLYRIITSMEAVEHWTVDGEDAVESAFAQLGESLEEIEDFELGQEADLVKLIANVKSSRALRILQAIDAASPGTAGKLLQLSEDMKGPEGKDAKLFLGRNLIFERLQLLSRVFAPERISLVLRALEGQHE